MIKITTRNPERILIASRSWFGGDIFNLSYVELFSEDFPQAAGKPRQAADVKRGDCQTGPSSSACEHGRCLHRPFLEALEVDWLIQEGHAQCQGQGWGFQRTHRDILILAQSLWPCFSFLYGQIFLHSLLSQLYFIWPITESILYVSLLFSIVHIYYVNFLKDQKR